MKKFLFNGLLVLMVVASAAAHPVADTIPLISSPAAIPLRDCENKTIFLRFAGGTTCMAIVFLSPECPLCQNYTSVLNQLSDLYKDKVTLYGIIPGKSYSAATAKKFKAAYHIRFDLLSDPDFQLTRLLKVTTTPQACLISRGNELLYTGLIDNWAASLKVRRMMVTQHYLASAVEAFLHHLPVDCPSTRPIGCLINTY